MMSEDPFVPSIAPAAAIAAIMILIYYKTQLQKVDAASCTGESVGIMDNILSTDEGWAEEEEDDSSPKCGACGRGGDDLKLCAACKQEKYCSLDCQMAHQPKHKEVCKKRAAELLDEALFKQPPPREECPICFVPVSFERTQMAYQTCCGKMVCNACILEATPNNISGRKDLCPFCRQEICKTDKQIAEKTEKRAKANDPNALFTLANFYLFGARGMQKNEKKAIDLYLKAGELGCVQSYYNVGRVYFDRYIKSYKEKRGDKRDLKKAIHYYQLAAIGGHEIARYFLGCIEHEAGNELRALKHWKIAADSGNDESLAKVRDGYVKRYVTKNGFEKTLRAHKESVDEVRSDVRDKYPHTRTMNLFNSNKPAMF